MEQTEFDLTINYVSGEVQKYEHIVDWSVPEAGTPRFRDTQGSWLFLNMEFVVNFSLSESK